MFTAKGISGALCAAMAAAGLGVGALTSAGAPAAVAAPDPCAASEVAKTAGMVATNTGAYLDAHPATNQALTTIAQQQAGPQSLAELKAYFDANPQVATDMQRLQQPLSALSGRCKLPVTIPQILGLMQAAQQPQQSAQPSPAVPGRLPGAQAVGSNGTAPVPRSPVASPGVGSLPGPAASAR